MYCVGVFTVKINGKKLGEKLCVMDPNFFVASRRFRLPGQQLSVNDRFKAWYSNMLCPFLLEGMDVRASVKSNSSSDVRLWKVGLTRCRLCRYSRR